MSGDGVSPTTISLLRNRQLEGQIVSVHSFPYPYTGFWEKYLDTLAFRQTNPRLLGPNDENVALSRRERVVDGVFDVHDVEAPIMTFPMRDDTHTTHVASTSRHGNDAGIEPDELGNLPRGEIDLDGIVDRDRRVRIADPTTPQRAKSVSQPWPFSS